MSDPLDLFPGVAPPLLATLSAPAVLRAGACCRRWRDVTRRVAGRRTAEGAGPAFCRPARQDGGVRGAERGCLRAGRADAQSTMGARGRVDLRDGGRGLLLGRQRRPDARGRRAGAPAARLPRGLRPGAGRVRTRRRGPAGGRGRGRLRRAALEGRPWRGAAGAARRARSPATGRQGGPRRRVGAGAAAGAAVPPGRVFCGGGARGGGGAAALIGCGAARGGRDAASGFTSPSGA